MYRILVMDSSEIDREMVLSVLSQGIQQEPIECFSSICSQQALNVLREFAIDLFILDVGKSTDGVEQLTRSAIKLHKHIDIVLTSVKKEGEVATLANKLHAGGYLLKPFRGDQLLDIIRPLMKVAALELQEQLKEETEKDTYLKIIAAGIQDCQYKKCIETAKEYIDLLYYSNHNKSDFRMTVVRMTIVEFAAGLLGLGNNQSQECKRQMEQCLQRFRVRYDLQSDRFEALSVVEEMIDIIFADLEKSKLYFDDDLKKVLNYIDRKVKKGITLDEAAEYINMSSSYFSKFFKKSTGVNFITYVIDRKIEYAKDMLEKTNMPIINIAYELSYNETNYFSKVFKKKVGISPTEYRDACLKQKEKAV